MSKSDIESIAEPVRIWAEYLCPNCYNRTTFIHDLKNCKICNNIDVIFCPKCVEHFKVNPPKDAIY